MRELILAEDDLTRELVKVPEWPSCGGEVWVRTMTGQERDKFEVEVQGLPNRKGTKRDRINWRARLAIRTVCDENGQPIFLPGDVTALGTKSAAALDRIFDVACRLSKLTEDDEAELEGN